MWSRRAIRQRQTGPVAPRPSRLGRRGTLEPLRSATNGPTLLADQPGKTTPALRSEWRISVGHEDLLERRGVW